MKFYVNILLILSIFLQSCSSAGQLNRSLLRSNTKFIPITIFKENQKLIDSRLKQAKDLLSKSSLDAKDIKLFENLLDKYMELKDFSTQIIKVPARSNVEIPLESYCLDSNKASPKKNERYTWKKGLPKIKYYSEVIRLRNSRKISQTEAQSLIWSLKNKTLWENYPKKYQKILKEIDPKANERLPTKLKKTLKEIAKDSLEQISGLSDSLTLYKLIKGKYYNYEDVKRQVLETKSKYKILNNNKLYKIESSEIYSESVSTGFSSQKVTLYNPTDSPQEIDISKYYLKPIRKDVQRIGVTPKRSIASQVALNRIAIILQEVLRLLGATILAELLYEKITNAFNKNEDDRNQSSKSVPKSKRDGTYRPDRKLPKDRDGNPIPESNRPHTQLGKKKGRKGEYTQGREFGEDGKPVKDIDFTDHGRSDHPNPHQHRHTPNPTGGTPQHGPTEPLTN
jgi:hypothetical protein